MVVQVADREPAGEAGGDFGVFLGNERLRARDVHEPHQVRVQIIDACVEDRDHDFPGAGVAGRPSLVREDCPHVPLARVERGRRRRRTAFQRRQGGTRCEISSGVSGLDLLA